MQQGKTRKRSSGNDGFAGDWALGCLIQVGFLLLTASLLTTDNVASVLVYVIILALPALAVRFICHAHNLEGGWFERLLGPGFLLAAYLLTAIHPLHFSTDEKEPSTPDATENQQASTDSQEASSDGNVNVQEADAHKETLDKALAELDALVGLEPVKAEVRKIANAVKIAQARKAAGMQTATVSYHMVFTGNPGTGKTTVARIIAKIFRALGVLDRGQLVETDRSGLVAEYVGQTATKTNRKIDEAIGGILFIDEAYALANDSYGQEAIATLLKRMEDDRGSLVVIVAGYTDEMAKFMDANAGLQSRFSRHIVFHDYSVRELGAIFRLMARKNKYVLSKDLEHWLDPAIGLWTKDRDRKFGNGRYVRNLFEKAVERQALRLSSVESPTKKQLVTLTLADVGISLKDPDASDED